MTGLQTMQKNQTRSWLQVESKVHGILCTCTIRTAHVHVYDLFCMLMENPSVGSDRLGLSFLTRLEEKLEKPPWCLLSDPLCLMVCVVGCRVYGFKRTTWQKASLQLHVLWSAACREERKVSSYVTIDEGWKCSEGSTCSQEWVGLNIRPLNFLYFCEG